MFWRCWSQGDLRICTVCFEMYLIVATSLSVFQGASIGKGVENEGAYRGSGGE